MRRFKYVSPGAFSNHRHEGGIAGRDYTWIDLYERRPVAVLSENLARKVFGSPGAPRLANGSETTVPGTDRREIVGVVQDVREDGVQQPAPETVYWPAAHGESLPGRDSRRLRARSRSRDSQRACQDKKTFVSQLRQAVWSVNSKSSAGGGADDAGSLRETCRWHGLVHAGDAGVSREGWAGTRARGDPRCDGVLGLAANAQGQWIALGAQPRSVQKMFVRSGLVLSGIGVAVGMVAAAALTRFMASLLFGIRPFDHTRPTRRPRFCCCWRGDRELHSGAATASVGGLRRSRRVAGGYNPRMRSVWASI